MKAAPVEVPEWFRGAIDVHVHSSPSIFPRLLSDSQVVAQAAGAGMRGVVLKAHEGSTVERAAIAEAGRRAGEMSAPDMADDGIARFTVRGGIVLNHFVGGLNPVAVELALTMGGTIVWLPTIHAANHLDYYGGAGYSEQRGEPLTQPLEPLSVVDESGGLKAPAMEVLEVVAARPGAVLNNGHLDAWETAALFREAKRMGIERLVIAHPELPLSGFDMQFQLAMVRLGAFIERSYLPHTETWGGFSFERTAHEIEQLGPEHCVLSTDLGQASGLPPSEGLMRFGAALIEKGLTRAAVELMLKRNPAELLGLEPIS